MNPFGTRAAADFARALDGGTAGTLPGLALAARLRTVGGSLDEVVAPRAEFRDALRMRLLAVATVQATAQTTAPRAARASTPAVLAAPLASAVSWRHRSGAVAAGAMACVVAVSGVAVAGSQSLPGDPFYDVKKTVEAFQLLTADGDVEKGTQHLEFAATRLREIRGLTLGRDAADAGPELGPAAMDGGITLRSATQPLAGGEALSAGVAGRVKQTLAEMDEQTQAGSALLNEAYRESRTAAPLRVLSTFAGRQAAGLEQLLPALPPRTQDRARISLALVVAVAQTTDELLSTDACGQGCDPAAAAPTLPGGSVTGSTSSRTDAPCACAAPAPAPAPGPSTPAEPADAPRDEPSEEPDPEPTTAPAPTPSSPAPSPSPSPSPSGGGLPAPVPSLPVPLPPLPVPLPTLTPAPLAPAVEQLLPGTSGSSVSGSSSGSAPVPAEPTGPVPLPQLAPLPPRP